MTPALVPACDQAAFDEIVSSSSAPVVAAFHAPWCPQTPAFVPVFAAAARTFGRRAQFVTVDVDAHREIADRLQIPAVPAVVVVDRSGALLARRSGTLAGGPLADFIARTLG